jgi:pimeloyl-ACP methyl ester carboxylesterase
MARLVTMPARLVFVHGSVFNGPTTWSAQAPLAARFDLEILNRPGFPPNPPVDHVDFQQDADWVAKRLRVGDHLVGHSYGGVIALLSAARAPGLLRSLTVVEPPAAGVALDDPAVARFTVEGADYWERTPRDDPEVFLRGFLGMVGSAYEPPSPLPADLEQGARTLMIERGPWDAEIPMETLASAPFPKLVVSGQHHAAFNAICGALERGLRAERVVLGGYGHSVQRHPEFNAVLADFVDRAAAVAG